ncbi:CDC27 family protein [Niabella ginsengisoli]|uniref:Tetratricopeptide repeat protein n=1 Tax=Niabella ginsengisoli TaxID=522298 RepID=A0ABS9SMQ4_9BACT|nr:CDC27 family protein [Niabella ginsengisoli]MCH5599434.1 tetratricopeptide repeat protein [Niabella ginsengisoli]
MKKTIHLLALGVLLNTVMYAQSVEDGVKAYYNGNYASAVSILEKSADKPEAAYWLAQSYFEDGKYQLANAAITKALGANANDPYLLAAKGQMQLFEKKAAEAKQSFDAAIAAAGKDEEDKAKVFNAVGHGITRAYNNIDKVGDINFAVAKLTEAKNLVMAMKEKKRDPLLVADIFTNLADATLKANPGEGSPAFVFYQEAIAADPTFAKAEYRKAMIFKSQNNAELYLQTLEKAIAANPANVSALEKLYDYYIFTAQDAAKAKPYGDKIVALLPPSPNNEYFKAVGLYQTKNYTEAINIGKNIISQAGEKTKPETYKLVAYSLIGNKDTAAAIPFVEDYFKNQAEENLVPKDYLLKATAYSTTPGKEADVVKTLMDAAVADTTVAGKVDILEQGAKMFAGKGALAGDLYAKILEIKPADRLTINDFFNAGYTGYYKSGQYEKAWKVFDAARTKFPKWNYGYMLAYGSSSVFDSTNAQNIMVPDGEKYIAYLQSPDDTSAVTPKRGEIFKTALALAIFYINKQKDTPNGLKFLQIAYNNADDPTAKEQVAGYIKAMGGTPGVAKSGATTDSTSTTAPAASDSTKKLRPLIPRKLRLPIRPRMLRQQAQKNK